MADRLELDYERTTEMFKLLAEIRFKLLAFVPTITGIGTALATDGGTAAETQLAVGLLGLVATLGILLYELRNSELYNWTIHRAKHLERMLGLSPSALGAPQGGVFGERVPPHRRFAGVLIKHDPALALVYGAALGAWTWLLLHGLLVLVADWSDRTTFWAALAGALAGGAFVAWQVKHHDRDQRMPKAIGPVSHFTEALAEVRRELARLAKPERGDDERKMTPSEKRLEAVLSRRARIMEHQPPGVTDDAAVMRELDRLETLLASPPVARLLEKRQADTDGGSGPAGPA